MTNKEQELKAIRETAIFENFTVSDISFNASGDFELLDEEILDSVTGGAMPFKIGKINLICPSNDGCTVNRGCKKTAAPEDDSGSGRKLGAR